MYTHICTYQLMKQEAMNLKESKEKHMKQFGGSKGKGK